jgi:hypothetical protein
MKTIRRDQDVRAEGANTARGAGGQSGPPLGIDGTPRGEQRVLKLSDQRVLNSLKRITFKLLLLSGSTALRVVSREF